MHVSADAGRSYDLEVDGVRIHAVEWHPSAGVDGSGPVEKVLLVHGLGANTLSWEPACRPFADRLGASVTAIDLIGFGRTRVSGRSASIAANARLVTAVLEQLGGAVVMGNSMGGTIGVHVAARTPELVHSLVLVDPAMPVVRPSPAHSMHAARFLPLMVPFVGGQVIGARARFLGPERVVDTSLGWSVAGPHLVDPDLRRRLIALSAERIRWPEAPAYADAARTMFVYLARGFETDLAALRHTKIPTLIVHGELDRLVPVRAVREAALRHPNLTLEVLGGIGHAPQLEAPGILVDVTARLARRYVVAGSANGSLMLP